MPCIILYKGYRYITFLLKVNIYIILFKWSWWVMVPELLSVQAPMLHLNTHRVRWFSENWVVSGIIGYGFKNTRPTYGAGVGYRFKSPMRRTLEFNYSDRLMKVGEDENILYLYENMLSTSETNIVAQLFKREEIDELLYCQKFRLRYDNEWFTGFQTRLQAVALRQESPKYYPFTQAGTPISTVRQQEVTLDFRFSWREKFMDDGLQRMYLTTYFPVVHFTVGGVRMLSVRGAKDRRRATCDDRRAFPAVQRHVSVVRVLQRMACKPHFVRSGTRDLFRRTGFNRIVDNVCVKKQLQISKNII